MQLCRVATSAKIRNSLVNAIMNSSYSFSSRISFQQDRGYVAIKHECNLDAKPWSKLFEQRGPGSESPIAPLLGAKKTRSLDFTAKQHETLERGNIDSSTPMYSQLETTTFMMAVLRHFKE